MSRSAELGRALREGLAGLPASPRVEDLSDADELETAIMAAAAIDLAVGGEILVELRGEVEEERRDAGVSVIEMEGPPDIEIEAVEELLLLADQDFSPGQAIAGAGLGPPDARQRAQASFDGLFGGGAPLATSFGSGMLTVGVSSALDAIGAFEGVHGIAERIRLKLRCGIDLIKQGIEKLVSLLGSENVVAVAADLGLDRVVEVFHTRVNSLGETLWRAILRAERSESEVDTTLEERQVNTSRLESWLHELDAGFANKVVWGNRINWLIKVFAIPITVCLAGGPGNALVAGANGIGLTVTLFLLADRLDTLPRGWGRVAGVPTIVREC